MGNVRRSTLILGGACALALSFALPRLAPAAPAPGEKPKAVVFTSAIRARELFDVLSYPARIVPKVSTTVLADTDGVVSRILAPLGQRVARGQKILTITHTDPVYQYAPMTVVAPVSGVVSLVDITEGSQVIKGQRLVIVTDPAKVRVDVEVPAADLASLSRGMTGEFRFEGSDEATAVRVRGISPFVDPATGTATCELEVAGKPKTMLAPGLLGQVSFKANAHSGVSIPESAIVYKGTDTFARVVDGGKARQVAVRLGRRQRGQVEVLSGLKDGATLIERASRYVADGETVTVQGAPAAASSGSAPAAGGSGGK